MSRPIAGTPDTGRLRGIGKVTGNLGTTRPWFGGETRALRSDISTASSMLWVNQQEGGKSACAPRSTGSSKIGTQGLGGQHVEAENGAPSAGTGMDDRARASPTLLENAARQLPMG